MENSHPNPHAIMFPLTYQGHVTPSVQLALKLASKGFTITFVNTQVIHHQLIKSQPHSTSAAVIEDDIFAGARELGLDIRYKTMTDGFPLEVNRILNPPFFLCLPLPLLGLHVTVGGGAPTIPTRGERRRVPQLVGCWRLGKKRRLQPI